MTRNPDLPCVVCGTLMWRKENSLPAGKATCRLCRKKARDSQPEPKRFSEWRTCDGCGSQYEACQPNQRWCRPECRPNRFRFIQKQSSAQRGYGAEHRKQREALRTTVEAGLATCAICGYRIDPGDSWHLDHTPDRTGYRGPAHASCNRQDGARRGGRRGNARR